MQLHIAYRIYIDLRIKKYVHKKTHYAFIKPTKKNMTNECVECNDFIILLNRYSIFNVRLVLQGYWAHSECTIIVALHYHYFDKFE